METLTETKNELALLVEKSGLEEATANSLQETFAPFYQQALEWNEKAKALKVTDATQLTEMQEAREARLAIKAIRVNVEKRRKELKEDSLKMGKAIDGVSNLLKALIEPTEAYLQEQEDFAKIAEEKRKAGLKVEREQKLQPFGITTDFYDLANMSEKDFDTLYQNTKRGYEERIAAEKKAEEERITREQEELKERERIRLENEQLKKEAEERERVLREERMKAEAERKAAEDAAERKLADERKKYEEEAAKIQAEERAKADAERKERERVEKELREKQEAEEKLKAELEAAAEAELSKGDKEKFRDYINAMEALKGKYQFKSKKYKALGASVDELLNKTINWAISKQ